jgi:hypothetical protein
MYAENLFFGEGITEQTVFKLLKRKADILDATYCNSKGTLIVCLQDTEVVKVQEAVRVSEELTITGIHNIALKGTTITVDALVIIPVKK